MMLKDLALFRAIAILGAFAAWGPAAFSVAEWFCYRESTHVLVANLNTCAYLGLFAVTPVAAVLGAAVLGEERNLDTLRFLANLPLSMGRIVAFKFSFATAYLAALWLPNIAILCGVRAYWHGSEVGPFGLRSTTLASFLLAAAGLSFAASWFFVSLRLRPGAAGLLSLACVISAYIGTPRALEWAQASMSNFGLLVSQTVVAVVLVAAGALFYIWLNDHI